VEGPRGILWRGLQNPDRPQHLHSFGHKAGILHPWPLTPLINLGESSRLNFLSVCVTYVYSLFIIKNTQTNGPRRNVYYCCCLPQSNRLKNKKKIKTRRRKGKQHSRKCIHFPGILEVGRTTSPGGPPHLYAMSKSAVFPAMNWKFRRPKPAS